MPRNLLNAVSTFLLDWFLYKKCPDACKNNIRWVKDHENMVDGAKSHIPRQ